MKDNSSASTDNRPLNATDSVPEGYKVASVPYQRDKEYKIEWCSHPVQFVGELYSTVYHAGRFVFQSSLGGTIYADSQYVFEKIEKKTLWLNVYYDDDEWFGFARADCYSSENAAKSEAGDDCVATVKVEFYQ